MLCYQKMNVVVDVLHKRELEWLFVESKEQAGEQ